MSRVTGKKYREKLAKEVLFVVFTFVVSIVIAFFISGTVVNKFGRRIF